jgi:hypothetical protein
MLIRNKYRFGDISIVCYEGQPQRIKETQTFSDLRSNLNQELKILLKYDIRPKMVSGKERGNRKGTPADDK